MIETCKMSWRLSDPCKCLCDFWAASQESESVCSRAHWFEGLVTTSEHCWLFLGPNLTGNFKMCVAEKTVDEVMHAAFEEIHPYPKSETVFSIMHWHADKTWKWCNFIALGLVYGACKPKQASSGAGKQRACSCNKERCCTPESKHLSAVATSLWASRTNCLPSQ